MGNQNSSIVECFGPCAGASDTTASWTRDRTTRTSDAPAPPRMSVSTVRTLGELTTKYIEKYRGTDKLAEGSPSFHQYQAIATMCSALTTKYSEPITDPERWQVDLQALLDLGAPPEDVVQELSLNSGPASPTSPTGPSGSAAAPLATPGFIKNIKPVDEPVTLVETPTAEEPGRDPELELEPSFEPQGSLSGSEPEVADMRNRPSYHGPTLVRMPAVALPAPGARERSDNRDHKAAAKAMLEAVKTKVCPSEHDVLCVLYDIDHAKHSSSPQKALATQRNAVKALYFVSGTFNELATPLAATGGVRIILEVGSHSFESLRC